MPRRRFIPHVLLGLSGIVFVSSMMFVYTDWQKRTSGSEEPLSSASAATTESEQEQRRAKRDSLMSRYRSISYHRVPLTSRAVLDSFRRACSPLDTVSGAYKVMRLLNRKDFQYLRVGDTLVMPDTIMKDLKAYSVFPQYWEGGDTIPKIILVSNTWQAYACYEYGELVRFAACNTGEERKPSFPGRYAVYWRQRLRISSLNDEWKLPFTVNFHLQAGSAFHQFDMPGRPVSHSCIRQFIDDAEWLYRWVRVARKDTIRHTYISMSGTPVIILDVFNFARRRGGPWLELASNDTVGISLPADPMSVEEALIPISQVPKESRGSLRNIKRYLTADSVLKARGVIRPHVHLMESINYNERRAKKAAAKRAAEAKAAQQKK
ncbi:MAG: L,D-transpeptidase [Candidatus Kapabacteria bacterium]|nr:L,D-transpeptidase [Candidatus Kapabacteria bacterium]